MGVSNSLGTPILLEIIVVKSITINCIYSIINKKSKNLVLFFSQFQINIISLQR